MKQYKLNSSNLSAISERVAVPNYNRKNITTGIVHVGVGGFHRAHEAMYIDQLLEDAANAVISKSGWLSSNWINL